MLTLTLDEVRLYNEVTMKFTTVKSRDIVLEHSLVSLSKWESNWCKPFLTQDEKTTPETIDYIKCMTISQNVDPILYTGLKQSHIDLVTQYIRRPMTATTIKDPDGGSGNNAVITSELIYYWMIALSIPVEFQKWHLNRLLMLIKVCNIKNKPAKKMNRRASAQKYAALNAARRKKYNTRG